MSLGVSSVAQQVTAEEDLRTGAQQHRGVHHEQHAIAAGDVVLPRGNTLGASSEALLVQQLTDAFGFEGGARQETQAQGQGQGQEGAEMGYGQGFLQRKGTTANPVCGGDETMVAGGDSLLRGRHDPAAPLPWRLLAGSRRKAVGLGRSTRLANAWLSSDYLIRPPYWRSQ